MMRYSFLIAAALGSAYGYAQTAELISGNLLIQEGTTVRFVGPLQLTIAPSASVVNDGLIDLGVGGRLSEPVGNPITGTGTEIASLVSSGPLNGVEPGGLGLSITTSSPSGDLVVTRGHVARSFPEGDPSIERWYRLASDAGTTPDAELVFRFDASELNGLTAEDLGLFRAGNENGAWSAVASTNNPANSTVQGTLSAPWGYITLFDMNAPTASPTLQAISGLQVWPTVTSGPLFIQSTQGEPLKRIDVIDGLGRSVVTQPTGSSGTFATLDLSGLSSGAYFLRVDQHAVIKLRKE